MLQAIHIRKQFQRSGEVLRDVSFTLGDGEFLSVIGPSGAGKTTLFRILNGTELCSGGEVLYGGTHFEAARGREKWALQQGIGTIYQDFCLSFCLTFRLLWLIAVVIVCTPLTPPPPALL